MITSDTGSISLGMLPENNLLKGFKSKTIIKIYSTVNVPPIG